MLHFSNILRYCGFAFGLLATQATAQDTSGSAASLETGASYSSQRGALAFFGGRANNLFGRGLDISAGYRAGDSGEALSLALSKTFMLGTTAFGQNTYVGAQISGRTSDWDIDDYAAEHFQASVTAGAQTAAGLRYNTRIFWQTDSIGSFSNTISPLVKPLDNSTIFGVGAGIGRSTFTDRGPLATGFDLSTSFTIATSAGDREWASAEISGQFNTALPHGFVLAVSGEAGQIAGLNGHDVNIVDRAFLGNPSPRGFAYGGIGPRDRTATVDTALGGNTFVTFSVELRAATPHPAITIGAFADAGALWNLDRTTGGASGTIDDSYALNASVGLSLYWDTPVGLMQLNVAKPIDRRDGDEVEQVSLNLNFDF